MQKLLLRLKNVTVIMQWLKTTDDI